MKKSLCSVLIAVLVLLLLPASAMGLEIEAYSAVLIDASTGRVIYEQNAHEALPPASTTKVLTALITLENVDDLNATVTAPEDFVNVGESGIYLNPGETLTYHDLLAALILRSANDAAQLLAIGVAGSEEAFVSKMNEWMEEHSLTDSTWHNVHGLDNPSNMVSAYDLAMIAREAVKNDYFNELVVTDSYTIPRKTDDGNTTVYNHNQFLEMYEYADGIKTGYTSLSKSCLVASATKDGMRLIGVILGGNSVGSEGSNYYQEMVKLMDHGFSNSTAVQAGKAGDIVASLSVNNGTVRKMEVVLGENVCFSVPSGTEYEPVVKYDLPDKLEAPLTAGQQIGTATFSDADGNSVDVPVLVNEDVPRYTFMLILTEAWNRLVNLFMKQPAAE